MLLLVFNIKNKFTTTRQTKEKQFEWWKLVTAALMSVALALLLATYAFSSASLKQETIEASMKLTTSSYISYESSEERSAMLQRLLPMAQVYCSVAKCVVTCTFIPAASRPGLIAAVFVDSDYESHCPDKIQIEELVFENCRFSNNALSLGWFPSKLRVKKLSLRRCALTTIDANSFSTEPFENLNSLSIIDNGVSVFQKSIFDALVNLEELVIVNNVIQQAEADLLAGTSNALQIVVMNNAIFSEKVLINIIGKSQLPRVLILSLTENFIQTISSEVFKGVPNVQSLYLTNSAIVSIEANAFDCFSASIRQLFLTDNNLSSLSSDVFQSILDMNSNFKLHLSNNDWNCVCDMQWLQNLTVTNLIVQDEPRCATPERNKLLKFSDAIFCEDETLNQTVIETTSQTTTSSTTTQITTIDDEENEITEADDDSITLTCDQYEGSSTTAGELKHVQELKFMPKFRDFFVKQLSNGSVYVSLATTSTSHVLIWFDNDFVDLHVEFGARCSVHVTQSLYLNELRKGASYTICLLDVEGRLTSPFNCHSLRTKPDNEGQLWLANKDKTMIISVLLVVLISVCGLSAIASYCVVRSNPRLLRGSKRIILVKHRAADAIVLPHGVRLNYGKDLPVVPETESSSSGSTTQTDYLTPMTRRRHKDRRASVISATSSVISYISGIAPTTLQLMYWRIGRIKEILTSDDPNEYQTNPPPLPPPRNESIPSLSLEVDERLSSSDRLQEL